MILKVNGTHMHMHYTLHKLILITLFVWLHVSPGLK